jgi:hypothetical protein
MPDLPVQPYSGAVMEILLPPSQGYIEKILTGKITRIRLPRTEVNVGDVITASAAKADKGKIPLAITRIETVPLYAISSEEAAEEGFISPDFCSSRYICGNIEVRIDFEDHVFSHEGGTLHPRNEQERENDAYRKLKEGCQSCVIKKDPKDLFLSWWKSTYALKVDNPEITKITFEIAS